MKTIVKSGEEDADADADASSSLSSLPDEIILHILNKLIDLKTLCFCYLVSRRFSSIVLQVDAISFSDPLANPRIPDTNTVGDVGPSRPLPAIIISSFRESFMSGKYFPSFITFLSKFKGAKSLRIEFPSSSEIGIDNRCLFKWMVKFGNEIESFMFLTPSSISDMDGSYLHRNGGVREEHEIICGLIFSRFGNQCLEDAMEWHILLLYLVENLPLLKEVSITDTGRRGRVSLSGEKLSELKDRLHSTSGTEFNPEEIFPVVSNVHIPVLNLPVSGYVMKGVYLGVREMRDFQGGYDDLMKSGDGFEDKEEAVYAEAVMEILDKHRASMLTMVDGVVV